MILLCYCDMMILTTTSTSTMNNTMNRQIVIKRKRWYNNRSIQQQQQRISVCTPPSTGCRCSCNRIMLYILLVLNLVVLYISISMKDSTDRRMNTQSLSISTVVSAWLATTTMKTTIPSVRTLTTKRRRGEEITVLNNSINKKLSNTVVSTNNNNNDDSSSNISFNQTRQDIHSKRRKRPSAATTSTMTASNTNNVFQQQKHFSSSPPNNSKSPVQKIQSDTNAVAVVQQQQHQQQSSSSTNVITTTTTTNIFGKKNKIKNNSDGSITSLHSNRIQNAGRVGTKRYMNPCQVYFGNLSYQITNSTILQQYICTQLGLPSHIIISKCNIIFDWKTHESKGYGFVTFTEPIYATMAIVKLHEQLWYNRTITVSQGVQKDKVEELQQIYRNAIMKKQIQQEQEEQQLIQQHLSGDRKQPTIGKDDVVYINEQEANMLKHLDPDLLIGVQIIKDSSNNNIEKAKTDKKSTKNKMVDVMIDDDTDVLEFLSDNDDSDSDDDMEYEEYDENMTTQILDEIGTDDELFDFDDDDDDDSLPWYYEDEIQQATNNNNITTTGEAVGVITTTSNDDVVLQQQQNRKQRREQEKSKKKIKLPTKGFGSN